MKDRYDALRTELETRKKQGRSAARRIAQAAADEGRDMTELEAVASEECLRDARDAKVALRDIPKPPKARVVRESAVYRDGGPHSWVVDMWAARSATPVPGVDPHAAEARLRRSAEEARSHRHAMSYVSNQRARKSDLLYLDEGGAAVEFRDLSYALGSGGEFTNPVTLNDSWANAVRSAAPLLDASDKAPLPDGCFRVVVPDLTAIEGAQPAPALQNTPLVPDDAASSSLESFVCIRVSEVQVSYQFLQRAAQAVNNGTGSGIDRMMATEAAESVAAQAEYLLFYGGGDAEAEPVGINTTVVGASQVVYGAGSGTAAQWQLVAGAAAEVGNNRLRYPTDAFMAPRRAAYLLGYPDGSGFVSPARPGTGPTGQEPLVGAFAGLRVWADGALPTDLTTVDTANTDEVFVGRPLDLLTMMSEPKFEVLDDAEGSMLAAVLRTRVYFASILRQPTAFSKAYSAGFVQP